MILSHLHEIVKEDQIGQLKSAPGTPIWQSRRDLFRGDVRIANTQVHQRALSE